jgi:hypothetical protein
VYPDVVDAPLDDLRRNDETLRVKYLIQPRGDKTCAEVASPALKVVEIQVGRTTLFDDDDLDISIELLGFPKKMDGKKRTGRSSPDDGDAITVQKTR